MFVALGRTMHIWQRDVTDHMYRIIKKGRDSCPRLSRAYLQAEDRWDVMREVVVFQECPQNRALTHLSSLTLEERHVDFSIAPQ